MPSHVDFKPVSCTFMWHLTKFILYTIVPNVYLFIPFTEACTSRNVPRPRTTTVAPTTLAPTTTPRPNITFPTFKCPGEYAKWYCLNGATCFAVQISGEYLFNCE